MIGLSSTVSIARSSPPVASTSRDLAERDAQVRGVVQNVGDVHQAEGSIDPGERLGPPADRGATRSANMTRTRLGSIPRGLPPSRIKRSQVVDRLAAHFERQNSRQPFDQAPLPRRGHRRCVHSSIIGGLNRSDRSASSRRWEPAVELLAPRASARIS